ncbi:MAG: hypothetical protein AB7I13_02165 [Vicinamibacterales bacterium]
MTGRTATASRTLVGLAALAALAACLIGYTFLNVRELPFRTSSFMMVAGASWAALLVTMILAGMLARRRPESRID